MIGQFAKHRIRLVALIVAWVALGAAPSYAQSPVVSGYGGGPGLLGEAETGSPSAAAAGPGSGPSSSASVPDGLPFTGTDVLLMILAGAAILGFGLLVRRALLVEHP